jgi:hypothetical protein
MSYKVRVGAKAVNITAVIRKEVTEALYKPEKMRVLCSAGHLPRGRSFEALL